MGGVKRLGPMGGGGQSGGVVRLNMGGNMSRKRLLTVWQDDFNKFSVA